MSIYEYNQELHLQQERDASWNEGKKAGIEEGIQILIESYREIGVSKEDTMKKVQTKYDLSNETVTEYLLKYWK